ncbi:MAG TPA: hypothetical protein VIG72_04975 [Pontibacter sp.]
MEQVLQVGKGEIRLSERSITIRDDAKKEKIRGMLSSSIWIVYGVISVLRYIKTGDQFLLWTGTVIGISHLVLLVLSIFRTTKAEIALQEISAATFTKRNGNNFLDLKLKSGHKRRISRIDPVMDELRAFLLEKEVSVR